MINNRLTIEKDTSGFHVFQTRGPKGIYSRHGVPRFSYKTTVYEVEQHVKEKAKIWEISEIYNAITGKYVTWEN